MTITFNYANVANMLKGVINNMCIDGFKWFPEVDGVPSASISDILKAIELLDKTPSEQVEIVEEVRDDR